MPKRPSLPEWASGVAYVLDAFQKKAKQGKKTPQADKDRVLQRYKFARQHYEAHYAARIQAARTRGQQP